MSLKYNYFINSNSSSVPGFPWLECTLHILLFLIILVTIYRWCPKTKFAIMYGTSTQWINTFSRSYSHSYFPVQHYHFFQHSPPLVLHIVRNYHETFCTDLCYLLHPLWKRWWSMQSDWLSAVWFIPKLQHFCSNTHFFTSQLKGNAKIAQANRFQISCKATSQIAGKVDVIKW